jgi:hypothetical protein
MVLEIQTLSGTAWMITLLGTLGVIMVVKWFIDIWP